MKKEKWITMIVLLVAGICLKAQEAVVTAGAHDQNEQYQLSWTLGEFVIETFYANDLILTQGFQQGSMTGVSIIPGDANCDGAVNVMDVIVMVNYFAGHDPEPFCFDNADINGDGVINVVDLIGTVNIFVQGKVTPYEGIQSETAHITLTNEDIFLDSDGTLAGLQFELSGIDIYSVIPELRLPHHELVYTVEAGVMRGMVYSFDNTPIPAGKIQLLSLDNTSGVPFWGEVLAANINASLVPVVLHRDETTGIANTGNKFSYAVYPNPATGKLFVKFAGLREGFVTVSLLNIHGQAVDRQSFGNINGHLLYFDVSALSPGIYTVRLTCKGFNYYEKVVIK